MKVVEALVVAVMVVAMAVGSMVGITVMIRCSYAMDRCKSVGSADKRSDPKWPPSCPHWGAVLSHFIPVVHSQSSVVLDVMGWASVVPDVAVLYPLPHILSGMEGI